MLANGVEPIASSGDQFVRIALMTGVEDELIAWRVEDVMQSQRQLDDAQVAAEVSADLGDHFDDPFADLLRELRKLLAIEFAEINR